MDWHAPTTSLLTVGLLIGMLQAWRIGTVVVRNRRRLGAQPMTAKAFQKDIDRILRSLESKR